MKTVMLSLLAFAAFLPIAVADCRARVVVAHDHVVVHQAAVIATPVVAATFLPIAVPAYSVTYQAPAVPGADPALAQEIAALRKEIAALKTGGKEEAKAGGNPDHLKIFAAKCASCHDKATATAKGGGFALLDGGQLAGLNFKQALRVGTKTYRGEMPPSGGKLTDEEVGAIQAWLDSLK